MFSKSLNCRARMQGIIMFALFSPIMMFSGHTLLLKMRSFVKFFTRLAPSKLKEQKKKKKKVRRAEP